MLQWTEVHGDDLIVERRGKPVAVLLAYGQEHERLLAQERKRQAFAALATLRRKIVARQADLTEEEDSRLAGLTEEVIAETPADNPPPVAR